MSDVPFIVAAQCECGTWRQKTAFGWQCPRCSDRNTSNKVEVSYDDSALRRRIAELERALEAAQKEAQREGAIETWKLLVAALEGRKP